MEEPAARSPSDKKDGPPDDLSDQENTGLQL